MSTKMLKSAFAGLVLSVSSFANAGLMNVKTIEIESAVGHYLQVAELVAWSNNSDLALTSAGATASASDFYHNNTSCDSNLSDASCVINGSGAMDWENIYHSYAPFSNSTLTITLFTPSEIDWVEIFGRTDDCCSSRDVYNITFFNDQHVALHSELNVSAHNSAYSTGRVILTESIPEPSTIAIFALGIIGLASRRFKE